MAPLTPRELAIRDRVESLIRLMEPGLNLILAAGERVSRLAGGDDDWDPPRPAAARTGPYPTAQDEAPRPVDDVWATGA